MSLYFRSLVCIALSVAVLGIAGCGRRDIRSAKEVAGEYAYPYANGPVEVFTLREDFTFRQELFPDIAAYRANRNSQFARVGTWSYKGNAIEFGPNYLFCKNFDPDDFLKEPVPISDREGVWYPPDSYGSGAQISFAEDFGYIAVRLTNRGSLERK